MLWLAAWWNQVIVPINGLLPDGTTLLSPSMACCLMEPHYYLHPWLVAWWNHIIISINGLLPDGTTLLSRSMACCLMEPHYYLNQWFVAWWNHIIISINGLLPDGTILLSQSMVCCLMEPHYYLNQWLVAWWNQVIISINVGLSSIRPQTQFNISIEIPIFQFKAILLVMLLPKRQPFCSSLNCFNSFRPSDANMRH